MSGFERLRRRCVQVGLDVAVAAIGAFDVWANCALPLEPWEIAVMVVTGAALLARRYSPIVVFVLTVPAVALVGSPLGPMAALYALARSPARRWLVLGAVMLLASLCLLSSTYGDYDFVDVGFLLHEICFAALVGVGPAALGWLVATRCRLVRQMAELDRAHAQERERHAASVRDHERAELAREMHDVVSHQVSLIAVQAGALQMVGADLETRLTAEAIREVSVDTLDELRQMVKVLQAPCAGGDISPQPNIQSLPALLARSGLPVELIGALPRSLAPARERAIYRTVQEALTNVRKHAPGAAVKIVANTTDHTVTVEITNVRSNEPPVSLPGAGSGISGLKQRAELLGGSVTTHTEPAGGWTLRLQLPRT